MPAKVLLQVAGAESPPQEFVFTGPTICTVGRARNCLLRLPSDPAHMAVSRHHCLFEIAPPQVRIRDLGSMNGTYVNGVRIGGRPRGEPAEQATGMESPDVPLQPGDEIRVGPTIFRISLQEG